MAAEGRTRRILLPVALVVLCLGAGSIGLLSAVRAPAENAWRPAGFFELPAGWRLPAPPAPMKVLPRDWQLLAASYRHSVIPQPTEHLLQESAPRLPEAVWWIREVFHESWIPADIQERLVPVKGWADHVDSFDKKARRVDAFVARYGVILTTPDRARTRVAVQIFETRTNIELLLTPLEGSKEVLGLRRGSSLIDALHGVTAAVLSRIDFVRPDVPPIVLTDRSLAAYRFQLWPAYNGLLARSADFHWWQTLMACTDGTMVEVVAAKSWYAGYPRYLPTPPEQYAMFGIRHYYPAWPSMRPDHDLNEFRWDPASFKDVEAEVVNRLGNDLADASSQAPAHVRWPTDEEIASFRASSQDTAKIRKFLEIIRSRIQAQVLPPDLEKRSVLLSENSPWGECLFARWTAPYSMAEGPAGEWPCIVQVSAGQKDLRIVCGLGGVLRFRPLYLRFPETPLRERNAGRLMAGIFREADKHSWIPFTLKAREVVMEGSPKSFETITVAGPGYPSRKETRPLVVGLFHTKPVSDFWWAHINFWTDGVTYYFGCPA